MAQKDYTAEKFTTDVGVLGLPEDADFDAKMVQAHFRERIKKGHSDVAGGNHLLATALNVARDRLLEWIKDGAVPFPRQASAAGMATSRNPNWSASAAKAEADRRRAATRDAAEPMPRANEADYARREKAAAPNTQQPQAEHQERNERSQMWRLFLRLVVHGLALPLLGVGWLLLKAVPLLRYPVFGIGWLIILMASMLRNLVLGLGWLIEALFESVMLRAALASLVVAFGVYAWVNAGNGMPRFVIPAAANLPSFHVPSWMSKEVTSDDTRSYSPANSLQQPTSAPMSTIEPLILGDLKHTCIHSPPAAGCAKAIIATRDGRFSLLRCDYMIPSKNFHYHYSFWYLKAPAGLLSYKLPGNSSPFLRIVPKILSRCPENSNEAYGMFANTSADEDDVR